MSKIKKLNKQFGEREPLTKEEYDFVINKVKLKWIKQSENLARVYCCEFCKLVVECRFCPANIEFHCVPKEVSHFHYNSTMQNYKKVMELFDKFNYDTYLSRIETSIESFYDKYKIIILGEK